MTVGLRHTSHEGARPDDKTAGASVYPHQKLEVGITLVGLLFARIVSIAAAVLLLGVCAGKPAYAYIDPGTGSYFLQIMAAFVLAALFVIRAFWHNLKQGVLRIFGRAKNDE